LARPCAVGAASHEMRPRAPPRLRGASLFFNARTGRRAPSRGFAKRRIVPIRFVNPIEPDTVITTFAPFPTLPRLAAD
ncbi:amidase, partial [Burkholderia pseudomallei]